MSFQTSLLSLLLATFTEEFAIRGTQSTYKKLAVQWLNEALCFVSSSVLADSLILRNSQLLVTAERYRKPYSDSANIKITDMKRTFLDYITNRLTTKPNNQRNEGLFFADPHFLFFNFRADTHLVHLVLPNTQSYPSQNQKSQIFPRFNKTITFDN